MAKSSPSEAAAQWASRLAQSGDKITRGVQSVTTSPGQLAARQKDVYAANVAASKDKWAARVASVSTGEWQQAVIDKGIPRIANGAQAAQPKMEQFMGQLLPYIDQVKGSLPARGNIDQNINRMTSFVRGMSKFQRR